jgi:LysM repeat protein
MAHVHTAFAQDFYLRYDPACMDRLEYRFMDNALDLQYYAYRVNKSATEKITFETGVESPRIQKKAPAKLTDCKKLNFDLGDVRDVNEGRKKVYICKKLDSGWAILPVGSASYFENANNTMTYACSNYELQADFTETMGNNLALRYPNEEVKAAMFYMGDIDACNQKAYIFKMTPSQMCRVDATATLSPTMGLIREKTAVCDLYELVSVNGRPVCDFLGGNAKPARVVSDVSENTPPSEPTMTEQLGVTYDNPASAPQEYSTVVRPKSTPQPEEEPNLTRAENFDESQAAPSVAYEADCGVAAAEGEHLIQRGESLYGIARRYGLSLNNLRTWNGLKGDAIKPCSVLKLYAPEAETATAETEVAPTSEPIVETAPTSEIPREYTTVVKPKAIANPKPVAKANCNVEATDGEHVVMQGETLTAIARSYGVKISDLKAWNGLAGDVIQPCQKLAVVASAAPAMTDMTASSKTVVAKTPSVIKAAEKAPKPISYSIVTAKQPKNVLKEFTIEATPLPKPIPVKPAAAPKQTVTAKSPYAKVGTGLHVVQKGETVAALAKKFKMGEPEFRKVNYLGKDEPIYIGQVLRSESCSCNVQVDDNSNLALRPAPLSNDLAGIPAAYSTVVKPKNTEGGVSSKSAERSARKYHVVQSGETVFSIAKLYKMDIAKLRTVNKLDENEVIIPNQLLVLE